jgi:hypothetical protein
MQLLQLTSLEKGTNFGFSDQHGKQVKKMIKRNNTMKSSLLFFFFFLFSLELHGSELWVNYYDPLSEEEFKAFTSSSASLPAKLCSFEHYFANQMKLAEHMFESSSWKAEVKEG